MIDSLANRYNPLKPYLIHIVFPVKDFKEWCESAAYSERDAEDSDWAEEGVVRIAIVGMRGIRSRSFCNERVVI